MSEATSGGVDRLAGTTRTEAFSDAVYAIVITLLAVEIHRPEFEPGELTAAVLAGWPSYAAYLLGFLYVGILWLNHHRLFQLVSRVDVGLLWINLGVIGTTGLIPFTTALLAAAFQSGDVDDQRIAVAAYAVVAGLMSCTWLPVWMYLDRHPELAAPGVPAGFFGKQVPRPVVGMASFAVAGVVGWFIHPLFGVAFIVFMVGYHAWTSQGVHGPRKP